MERIEIGGPNGAMFCEWSAAALLRDNVMHWLEDEEPSGRFPAIHALADWSPTCGRTPVRAEDLADELAVALPLLREVRGKDLAIGIWTRARMTGQQAPPTVRGTVVARLVGWTLPMPLADDASLEECYRPFLDALRSSAGRQLSAA